MSAQPQPAWIAYAAPLIAGNRNLCCSDGCALESRSNTVTPNASGDASGTVHLEGAPEFNLFFRIENRQVEKIRSFSMDCNVDAGGLTVYWLTGARPAQSVALLESLLPLSDARPERRLSNSIISAIAFHRDAAADSALDRLTVASQPEETRRQAAFWLGNARGRHGYESLLGILRNDPSDRVREHAIFALTQSKEAGAIPAIVREVHDDKSPRVRSQALFWLAQKAAHQISADAIREAIDRDPETQVKKKAVFALTQVPNGDGVPLLIELARRNSNPVVRKEAMFWLGQSKDPRAAKFFEDVLVTR